MDEPEENYKSPEKAKPSPSGMGGGRGSGRRKTRIGAGGSGNSGPGKKRQGAGDEGNSQARNVLQSAQEEAARLRHNFVGTEQILIALIRVRSGTAGRVLFELGLRIEDVRREVEAIIGRGSGFVAVEIPFTPRAKRVLELAWDEARQLGHNYIGTEHILLGLVREGEGVAVRVLEKFGVKPAKVRALVLQHLQET